MLRRSILATSLIILIALVSSTLVQPSRRPPREGLRGDNISRNASAVPRIEPVPTASTGAAVHGQDPDHERQSPKGAIEGTNASLLQLLPLDQTAPIAGQPVDFSWTETATAARY